MSEKRDPPPDPDATERLRFPDTDPETTLTGPLNPPKGAGADAPQEVFDPDATLKPARRRPDPAATPAGPLSVPEPESEPAPGHEPEPEAAGSRPFDPDATLDPTARKFDPDITVTSPVTDFDPDATVGVSGKKVRRRANPFAPKALPEGLQANLAALGGLNPLVAFANPVFGVVPEIHAAQSHPDPALLKETLQDLIEAFEAGTSAAGMTPDTIEASVYALCCVADDAAAATPWGSDWTQTGLLQRMRKETQGGEAFFTLLEEISKYPKRNADLLEFLYVCLALGFEGRYRNATDGSAELAAVRAGLHALITRTRPRPDGLSERWRGVDAIPAPVSSPDQAGKIPWRSIGSAVAALLVLVGYALFRTPAQDVPPAQSVPPVLAPPLTPSSPTQSVAPVAAPPLASQPPANAQGRSEPMAIPTLREALADAIASGMISLKEDRTGAVIAIRNDRQFEVAGVEPDAGMNTVIDALARSLDRVPGAILVLGHTSSPPIRTRKFSSNDDLAAARAGSVARRLAAGLREPRRVTSQGMGAREPIAPNDSEANRAKNRRVEIRVPATGAVPAAGSAGKSQ